MSQLHVEEGYLAGVSVHQASVEDFVRAHDDYTTVPAITV